MAELGHATVLRPLAWARLGFAAGIVESNRRASRQSKTMTLSEAFYRAIERRIEWLTVVG